MNSVYLVERKWEGTDDWQVACVVDSPKTAIDIIRATYRVPNIGLVIYDEYRFQLVRTNVRWEWDEEPELLASFWCRLMEVVTGEPS